MLLSRLRSAGERPFPSSFVASLLTLPRFARHLFLGETRKARYPQKKAHFGHSLRSATLRRFAPTLSVRGYRSRPGPREARREMGFIDFDGGLPFENPPRGGPRPPPLGGFGICRGYAGLEVPFANMSLAPRGECPLRGHSVLGLRPRVCRASPSPLRASGTPAML